MRATRSTLVILSADSNEYERYRIGSWQHRAMRLDADGYVWRGTSLLGLLVEFDGKGIDYA